MSKTAVALVISLVIAGNTIIITLLLSGRLSGPQNRAPSGDAGDAFAGVLEAIDGLRRDMDRWSRSAPPTDTASPAVGDAGMPSGPRAGDSLEARVDEVIERLEGLEKTLATMRDVDQELAAAKLRKERETRFRADDGFVLADDLLAQKQYAVGANGILTFLDAHPDHPDARDLMMRAVDAFRRAGYGEKALWLHQEMMKKFPDPTGSDHYSLAMLEQRMRKYDDALRHIDESVELAPSMQHRLNRMFYRAFLIHQREGDPAGLAAYREVERIAREFGGRYPTKTAKERADEIEQRLAAR